jgi:hypothetical protein
MRAARSPGGDGGEKRLAHAVDQLVADVVCAADSLVQNAVVTCRRFAVALAAGAPRQFSFKIRFVGNWPIINKLAGGNTHAVLSLARRRCSRLFVLSCDVIISVRRPHNNAFHMTTSVVTADGSSSLARQVSVLEHFLLQIV